MNTQNNSLESSLPDPSFVRDFHFAGGEDSGFLWKCELCGTEGSDTTKRISKARVLAKHSKRVGFKLECVCALCHGRSKKIRATVGLASIKAITQACDRISQGSIPNGLDSLLGEARELKSALEDQIRSSLAKLHSLNESRNLVASSLTSIEAAYASFLWETYPERRKRANYAISQSDLRLMVFSRDGYKCKACGSKFKLSLDHIKPVLLGGNNDPQNLQTLCLSCNSRKGANH